jgi:peptidoglycan/xylan/chitin deacetylase (PgdA/CDA1 family)
MTLLADLARLFPLLLVAAGLSAGEAAVPDPHSGPARVAHWDGDRAGALAFTFDDGQREQAIIAAPLLEAVGLRATFVINPGKTPASGEAWNGSWDDWRALAKKGHEIGNHSMTHPNFTSTPEAKLQEEIVDAQQRIAKEIGEPCVTFAYPFNAETPASRELVRKTHPVWTGGERKAYGGPAFTAAKANAWADEAIAKHSLVIAMIHGIETGYLPFAGRAIFKEHLDYVKSKEADLWVAPLGTIGRYQLERAACQLDAKAGAGQVVFTLTSSLDPALYTVPLTVVVDCGTAGKTPSAKREGAAQPIVVIAKGNFVLCEIVPGKGAVTVKWK